MQLNLHEFMAQKGEAYSNIDTARMPIFWSELGNEFHLPQIVQTIGTNGKGSTGRILAHFMRTAGYKVGHYTSPHLLRFNERYWINGSDATDEALEAAHRSVVQIIGEKWANDLSYFEYATVLAAKLFEGCDYAVIEAGLGGEFDATTVFDAELLLITPIGIDHQHLLGDTIASIATTKLRAMRSTTIIAKQKHSEVVEIARKIASERNQKLILAHDLAPVCDHFESADSPAFMAINRQLAFAAANHLGLKPKIAEFKINPLFGRLTKIAPNIFIDVGHNAAAAHAIVEAFSPRQVVVIYNSYTDKAFDVILKTLKPIIKRLFVLRVEHPRIVDQERLLEAIKKERIEWSYFDGKLDPAETYIVFGSFSVVETFLKTFNAR
ncbi:bifunctional folylpolyglutamate synthase/dihydrofolate synthase [Campylobacterota bacterium]|nr:bifunctional folylpolyglutamate synthase/dihydrofolate synthase [Campylobacterota bacterium]